MKLSNFKLTRKVSLPSLLPGQFDLHGTVDITTGHLWWKKTITVEVFKPALSTIWRRFDTGDQLPWVQMDNLYETALAKQHAA